MVIGGWVHWAHCLFMYLFITLDSSINIESKSVPFCLSCLLMVGMYVISYVTLRNILAHQLSWVENTGGNRPGWLK